ncbi:MAG TPA: hypothetical protein VMV79_06595 [Alphaproteobacteria bacterium]|nr:hypothetical protein [Alphaproteobacteria bacterium]
MLTLVLGQGAAGAMAMPMQMAGAAHQMAKTPAMAGQRMSVAMPDHSSIGWDCCSTPEKNRDMKAAMCEACCAASVQPAVLPLHSYIPARYAVGQSFEPTDTSMAGLILPPDLPPPRA